jgi:hypothetical protein
MHKTPHNSQLFKIPLRMSSDQDPIADPINTQNHFAVAITTYFYQKINCQPDMQNSLQS